MHKFTESEGKSIKHEKLLTRHYYTQAQESKRSLKHELDLLHALFGYARFLYSPAIRSAVSSSSWKSKGGVLMRKSTNIWPHTLQPNAPYGRYSHISYGRCLILELEQVLKQVPPQSHRRHWYFEVFIYIRVHLSIDIHRIGLLRDK